MHIKKDTKEYLKFNISVFALLFFFSSMLIYVFLDRDSSYLSSRYFYLAAVPAGIIFGYFLLIFKNFFWAFLRA